MSSDDSASDDNIIELKEGKNIISDNPDIRDKMTRSNLCGGGECAALLEFKGRFDAEAEPEKYPWLLPQEFKKGEGPGTVLYIENSRAFDIFVGNDKEREKWLDIDYKYANTYRPEILAALTKTEQPITIAMINGFGADNNLKGIPNDNYYWQTINYLFTDEQSGRSYAKNFAAERGGYLNELLQTESEPASRPNINILVVPIEDAQKYYEARGYITVVFDGVVTRENLDNLGKNIMEAVQRFTYSNEIGDKQKQAQLALQNNLDKAAKKVGKI
jgi:hypothetical protein